MENKPKPAVLPIGMGKRRTFIKERELIYLEGDGNYSKLVSKRLAGLTSKSLITYEQQLPSFLRIHKRFLVNPAFIEAIEITTPKAAKLLLTNGQRLTIGRRRISLVQKHLRS